MPGLAISGKAPSGETGVVSRAYLAVLPLNMLGA